MRLEADPPGTPLDTPARRMRGLTGSYLLEAVIPTLRTQLEAHRSRDTARGLHRRSYAERPVSTPCRVRVLQEVLPRRARSSRAARANQCTWSDRGRTSGSLPLRAAVEVLQRSYLVTLTAQGQRLKV